MYIHTYTQICTCVYIDIFAKTRIFVQLRKIFLSVGSNRACCPSPSRGNSGAMLTYSRSTHRPGAALDTVRHEATRSWHLSPIPTAPGLTSLPSSCWPMPRCRTYLRPATIYDLSASSCRVSLGVTSPALFGFLASELVTSLDSLRAFITISLQTWCILSCPAV